MASAQTPEELTAALGRLLSSERVRARAAERGVTLPTQLAVEDLHRLSAGASRETWTFAVLDGADDPASQTLVLQRVRPGLTMDGPSAGTEGSLLEAARRAGVPVPTVVADAEACGAEVGPGLVCTHVEGETLGPRIVREERYAEARRRFADDAGRALAAIHSIDPDAVDGLAPVDTLGRLRTGLDGLDVVRPAFELALRWLHANRPSTGPPSVVHGDFRMGNLVVGDTGLRAVLDWELAHRGDPLEDLGWLCVRAWRFGGDGEVGGVGTIEDLLDAYGNTTGRPVDPEAVRWWMVAGTLTWGLICAVQAHRHLDGHVRSVELAAIGRRVCETEYDLLNLLHPEVDANFDPNFGPDPGPRPAVDEGPPEVDPYPDADADEAAPAGNGLIDLQGRPTAAELVTAVREHLTGPVAAELTGGAAYHLKVAANALGIVERELRLGPTTVAGAERSLARLGLPDEAAVAAAVRNGTLDGADPSVLTVVRSLVVDRLRIANPKWLHPADHP